MLRLITAAALAVAVASPAFAQPREQFRDEWKHTPSANPQNDVYSNGFYAGSDPDPQVRLRLRIDRNSGTYGNAR